MKVIVEIPDEFTKHFNDDRFEDSLLRLKADARFVAGNYERELADMLIESFRNGEEVEE